MKVKSESEVAQSRLTLHDPMDCSLPGSSAHGIFQGRVLEWGAIALGKYKSKTTMRYHLTPTRMPMIKKKKSVAEAVEKLETSYTAGGNVNLYSHCGKHFDGSLES